MIWQFWKTSQIHGLEKQFTALHCEIVAKTATNGLVIQFAELTNIQSHLKVESIFQIPGPVYSKAGLLVHLDLLQIMCTWVTMSRTRPFKFSWEKFPWPPEGENCRLNSISIQSNSSNQNFVIISAYWISWWGFTKWKMLAFDVPPRQHLFSIWWITKDLLEAEL